MQGTKIKVAELSLKDRYYLEHGQDRAYSDSRHVEHPLPFQPVLANKESHTRFSTQETEVYAYGPKQALMSSPGSQH